MKNSSILWIIIGLLLFTNIGLVMMSHMDGQDHDVCPFETAGATNCALVQTPIDFVVAHINAFSAFFAATIVVSVSGVALFYLFSLIGIVTDLRRFRTRLFSHRLYRQDLLSFFQQRLSDWFSLHENSPSLTYGR